MCYIVVITVTMKQLPNGNSISLLTRIKRYTHKQYNICDKIERSARVSAFNNHCFVFRFSCEKHLISSHFRKLTHFLTNEIRQRKVPSLNFFVNII